MSDATFFGQQINETQCAYYANKFAGSTDTDVPDTNQLCGLIFPDTIMDDLSYASGLLTLSNTSSVTRVAFTQDRHAIMVAPDWPQLPSYTASTIGLHASCQRSGQSSATS